ncbi:MAG: hypothetical protein ACOVK2_02435 [Candidatus Fonsibacter sp.]
MENKQYKKRSLQDAIQALEDEVLNIRIKRDESFSERVKESLNGQILSFILCIQHLKDVIGDENE